MDAAASPRNSRLAENRLAVAARQCGYGEHAAGEHQKGHAGPGAQQVQQITGADPG
jgi:hypothetical protein